MEKDKFVVVIPSYEPDERLIDYVKALKNEGIFNVIVVNDGSGVDTVEIFQKLDCLVTVLENEKNCGKGFSLKKSFQYILENYSEETVVITVDSDGQHQLMDVLHIMEVYKRDTLLLGARDFMTAGVPVQRRFSNQFTAYLFTRLYHCKILDTQTGLRAFSYSMLADFIQLSGNHFEYEMNVLKYCAQKEIPIVEVPIQTIYFKGNKISHFKPIRDSWLIYKNMFRK